MTQRITYFAFAVLVAASVASGARADDARDAVDAVLDGFHDAAHNGDKERYLGLMTENGVFLGTDEWERWPKHPDFTEYVDGRFQGGSGWSYRSVERNVEFSPSGDVAWFDEVVFSETWGRFRGTGVLVRADGDWKIAHYALSFLIFNENWQEVAELTKQTAAEKEAAGQ